MLLCLVYTYFLFLSLSVIARCFVSFILVQFFFTSVFIYVTVLFIKKKKKKKKNSRRCLRTAEDACVRQKMLAYGERVRRVEHGTLTPLVFTCTGGAGPSGSQFIKRLASKISDHRDMPYSQAVGWLRCRVSFALLRSAIICLRGSRGKKQGASIQPAIAATHARINELGYMG